MQEKGARVVWIDGLRGLACLGVFAHHLGCSFFPVTENALYATEAPPLARALAQSPLSVLLNGNFWVCVFCVIAGYVAARPVFDRDEQGAGALRRLSGGLLKRYLRLVLPVFVLSVIVTLLYKLHLFTNMAFFQRYSIYWNSLSYAEDIYTVKSLFYETFVRLCFVGTEKYIMVLWSLSYLFYGYFLAVLLAEMSWGRSERIVWVYWFFSLCFWIAGEELYLYACFPFGVYLAYRARHPRAPLPEALRVPAVVLLVLVGLFLGAYPTFYDPINVYRYLNISALPAEPKEIWHALGAVLLMSGLCLSPRLQKLLSGRALLRLGGVSFCLYLIHIPVLFTLGTGCAELLSEWGLESYGFIAAVSIAVTVIATLLLSALFRRWVEQPCEKLSRKLLSLLDRPCP